MKLELGKVSETLLVPVRARAEETLRSDSLLSDTYSVDILEKITVEASSVSKMAPSYQIGIVIRTIIFDRIVADFLKRHPDGVIISLGCGLDARYERLHPVCYCWYDLDMPEVIEARRKFFQDKENYTMIPCSMLDYEWMKEIPTDKPLLIISEGVFMYFIEKDLESLVKGIFRRFPNAEIAFDSITSFLAKQTDLHSEGKKCHAKFRWEIDHPEDLKRWDKHIEIIGTEYYMDFHRERWPLGMRLMNLIPKFRRGNKVMHIRFKP